MPDLCCSECRVNIATSKCDNCSIGVCEKCSWSYRLKAGRKNRWCYDCGVGYQMMTKMGLND